MPIEQELYCKSCDVIFDESELIRVASQVCSDPPYWEMHEYCPGCGGEEMELVESISVQNDIFESEE